jgi:hypothetical protein
MKITILGLITTPQQGGISPEARRVTPPTWTVLADTYRGKTPTRFIVQVVALARGIVHDP